MCHFTVRMTHEAERGSAGAFYHVSIGALIGLFLLWRVFRRIQNGFTQETNQHFLLNLLSKIVHWGLLAVIVVVVLTGYLLPWSRGAALDVAGLFSIPSPFSGSRGFHEFIEETHDIAGHLFMPLIALHILGSNQASGNRPRRPADAHDQASVKRKIITTGHICCFRLT